MKKGYTLIELLISISILAVIMAAVATIFITSIKNYRTESQKSTFQKELNFVVDNIAKDVKEAAEVPEKTEDNVFFLSPAIPPVLILAIPATNSSNDFIYNVDGLMEKDYVVYYLSGQDLKRKIYANNSGSKESSDNTILKNVSNLTFTYSPTFFDAGQVKTEITVSIDVGRTVTLSAERLANLRNKE